MNRIKVLVLKPQEEEAVVKEIDNDLGIIREIVGGYFITARIYSDVLVVSNEEGSQLKLPFNRAIGDSLFYGTILFVRIKGSGLISLTDDDVHKIIKEYLKRA